MRTSEDFQSVKCNIELQKYVQQVAQLEKVIADNMFQWECCARGGNTTENGGCDFKLVEQVNGGTFIELFVFAGGWKI